MNGIATQSHKQRGCIVMPGSGKHKRKIQTMDGLFSDIQASVWLT
jgi:hypothetical protein